MQHVPKVVCNTALAAALTNVVSVHKLQGDKIEPFACPGYCTSCFHVIYAFLCMRWLYLFSFAVIVVALPFNCKDGLMVVSRTEIIKNNLTRIGII